MHKHTLPQRRNIEIKARAYNLDRLRELALGAGAKAHAIEIQTDTYFAVPRGRMKLRERVGQPAYLICYQRADQTERKTSHYDMLDIADPELFLSMLGAVLEVRVAVQKHREVLLYKNVRIHLDRVEGLGEFMELEAVLTPEQEPREGETLVRELMDKLEIAPVDLIAESYVDMLERRITEERS